MRDKIGGYTHFSISPSIGSKLSLLVAYDFASRVFTLTILFSILELEVAYLATYHFFLVRHVCFLGDKQMLKCGDI